MDSLSSNPGSQEQHDGAFSCGLADLVTDIDSTGSRSLHPWYCFSWFYTRFFILAGISADDSDPSDHAARTSTSSKGMDEAKSQVSICEALMLH